MNKIKSINIYILVGIFFASFFFSLFALRQNHLNMIELRAEVIKIDEETGDLSQIEPKLNELANYIITHMNAEMPQPLELPGAYAEAVESARKKAEQSGSANAEVYRRAQSACENPNEPLSVRAQCIQNYVIDNAKPGTNPTELKFPPKELYTHDFYSPAWSFDLAGIAVLLTLLLAGILLIRVWLVIFKYIKQIIENDPLE